MWPLFIENKQQLDKQERRQNYVIHVFFSKKIYFQRQKAINYEKKNLNRFVHSQKERQI